MNRIHKFLMILLVVAVMAPSYERAAVAQVTDADKKVVVEGNNMFAIELYAELKGRGGNLFFSPYSISTALAMTYAGARGNTETQMARVLHFDLPQERLHPTFRKLITELNAQARKGYYELNIANALWVLKGYRVLKEFIELIKTNYGAEFDEVYFDEKTRRAINAWVEKQTKGKIKELIKPGMLNEYTRLVLTNAIYFKGNWASQFDKKLTKDSPFYMRPDETVDVPMMYQEGNFKYMENEKVQMIELPYVGNELSMVVILPKEIDGLVELENSLTLDTLKRWLDLMREGEVRVYLPKFTVTLDCTLNQTLASMGMTDAFTPGLADFSGMFGHKGPWIGLALHKAFVEVNEEGTEAAAATAVILEESVRRVLGFRADHPFIFLIRDMRSGSILFSGRLVNPLE